MMVEGKYGIYAKVVADSINEQGNRLTTFELSYPRIIHAEFMTHRMFSRNAASSRAIPFAKMKEQLTGRPVRFGANVSGMQDNGEHSAPVAKTYSVEAWWRLAALSASKFSEELSEAGYHKQVFNRITEPFQMMKVVCTATEYDNFFWLRDDSAADPTIAELARCMREAHSKSEPELIRAGEYHLPYIYTARHGGSGEQLFFLSSPANWDENISLDEAIKVSCARCAAVSFRNVDYDVEKSSQVYERLVGADRKHASALEHVATPMETKSWNNDDESGTNLTTLPHTWETGVSHADRDGNLWSGNFKGWIQYRKTLQGENYNRD